MNTPEKKLSLTKKLAMWLGSYAVVGTCLVLYFGAPLRPVIVAGLLTFITVLAQHFFLKDR